jgi:hypothetical protein
MIMTDTLSREDEEHLRYLTIGHYVVAGLMALAGLFPMLHLAMGIWMLTSADMHSVKDGPPAMLVGAFFVVFALAWILISWTLAALLVYAGRSITQRRRRTFCLAVASVAALMCMPFGTLLGIFTIIVLLRPSVRDAFDQQSTVLA